MPKKVFDSFDAKLFEAGFEGRADHGDIGDFSVLRHLEDYIIGM